MSTFMTHCRKRRACILTSIFSSAKGYFHISRAVLFSDISSCQFVSSSPHTNALSAAETSWSTLLSRKLASISYHSRFIALKKDVPKYLPDVSKLAYLYYCSQSLGLFLYGAIRIRLWRWVHEAYGAIFRGLISHPATQLAAFIFHACGSVTPGSPLMWQAEAQTKMRQREGRLRKRERWKSTMGGGGLFWWCRFRRGTRERKKSWYELAGSRTARWSHHLTDLWRLAPRAGPRWVGGEEGSPGWGERDRVMVGGWERAQWWRELIETSAPLQ